MSLRHAVDFDSSFNPIFFFIPSLLRYAIELAWLTFIPPFFLRPLFPFFVMPFCLFIVVVVVVIVFPFSIFCPPSRFVIRTFFFLALLLYVIMSSPFMAPCFFDCPTYLLCLSLCCEVPMERTASLLFSSVTFPLISLFVVCFLCRCKVFQRPLFLRLLSEAEKKDA